MDSIADWRRAGMQDAANVMDLNQLEEDLGRWPSQALIKAWLMDMEPEDQLELPDDISASEKAMLVDAWADGWSEYAYRAMRQSS